MSKKKKRRRRTISTYAKDRHHICYPKNSDWGSGYAKAICQAFVRPVYVSAHRELHSRLHSVPVPDGQLLKVAWQRYLADKAEIDTYDVTRAAAWLYVNVPDERFRAAMQFEIDFFTTKNSPR